MVVNYVLPENDLQICTHGEYQYGRTYYSDNHKTEPVEEALINTVDMKGNRDFDEKKFDYCSLKLMKKQGEAIIEVKEIVIEPDDEAKQASKDSGKKLSIEFSPNGEYLALLAKKENVLKIYRLDDDDETEEEGSEILKLFEDIEHDMEPYLLFDGNNSKINCQLTKRLEFDAKNKYLIVYGLMNMRIIPLYKGRGHTEFADELDLNDQIFTDIIDCQLVSDSNDYEKFECKIAAHVKDEQSVAIIDFFDTKNEQDFFKREDNPDRERKFTYFNEDITCLDVKISEDFQSAVLVNKTENYILYNEDDQWHQESMMWLHGKQIRGILSHQDRFLFVCCKEYDRGIDIMSSHLPDFKIQIRRRIEPNTVKVFDFLQEIPDANHGLGNEMDIVILRDQEFFYDRINPFIEYENHLLDKHNILNERNGKEYLEKQKVKKKQYKFNKYRGFGALWPYAAFQGIEPDINYLWLLKAYDENVIHRILMPNEHDNIQIVKTYITESNDLFVVCETVKGYNIYKIDLEVYRESGEQFFQPKLITEDEPTILKSDVKNKILNRFQARSGSKASDANQIHKQIIFLYFGNTLYSITEGGQDEEKISTVCKALDYEKINDGRILVQAKTSSDLFRIDEVNIEINDIRIDFFYSEKLNNEKMNLFAYDHQSGVLMTMRAPNKKGYRQKSIRIYDKFNENSLWNSKVFNDELIGRLKTQFFQFIDGHIYYNNSVIKVRYDLLNMKRVKDLADYEVFDYYDNIFTMNDGDQFMTDMPQQMFIYHRLFYLHYNKKELSPSVITFTPFLHERKIYLSRMNEQNEYFFSSYQYQCDANQSSSQHRHSSFFKSLGEVENLVDTDFISIDFTEKNVKSFRSNGILKYQFDFKELVKDYGKPIKVSNNGHIFVFRTKKTRILHLFLLDLDKFIFLKSININESIYNFIKELEKSPDENASSSFIGEYEQNIKHDYQDLLENEKYVYNIKLEVNNNLDVMVVISKDYHKQIKEKENNKFQSNKQNLVQKVFNDQVVNKVDQKIGAIIYIQKGYVNLKINEQEKQALHKFDCKVDQQQEESVVRGQHLIFTKTDGNFVDPLFEEFSDQSMNTKYCLFWNSSRCWYIDIDFYQQDIDDQKSQTYFKPLSLSVDKKDKVSSIKKIRTGNNPNEVAILIRQSIQSDCVITWNIKNDDEMESFDMNSDPKIFFDKQGKCCLTEDNLVCITEQGIKLTTYDVEKLNADRKDKNKKNLKFGFHFGQRFDQLNYEWIYLRDYIMIPYSYMTFVIKSKVYGENENYNQEDYRFDIEQYNYLFEGKTAFTDDIQTVIDHERLSYILTNFERIDMVLLEQIQFYHYDEEDWLGDNQSVSVKLVSYGQKITPLHIAMNQKNSRSVRILLKYMALIDSNCSETYKDIIHLLVDYDGFSDYLYQLPLQTMQMSNKQTLKIGKAESNDIVANNSWHTSYIDQIFYNTQFQEVLDDSHDFKTYPVEVKSLKVQWILHEPEGMKFLAAIYQSENIDLFEIPAVQIIISFLYKQYKSAILRIVFPVYFCQLVFFFTMLYFAESKYTWAIMMKKTGVKNDVQCDDACQTKNSSVEGVSFYYTLVPKQNWSSFLTYLSIIANIIVMGILIFQFVKKVGIVGLKRTKGFLLVIDIIYVILNSAIIYFIIVDITGKINPVIDVKKYKNYKMAQRTIQSILAILIWFKSLEFLKLFDVMAPLISIIYQIIYDIRFFLVTLFVSCGGFATSYYLIGKNQMQYDFKKGEEVTKPPYHSVQDSLQFIYLQLIGELSLDTDYFDLGNKGQNTILYIIFTISTFVLILHLMNMLIGIMTATFANNSVIADQRRTKEHLNYILDNDWIKDQLPYKSKDKFNITYLVTAFMNEEDYEDIQLSKEILVDTKEMRHEMNRELENVLGEIKKIKAKVNNIKEQKDQEDLKRIQDEQIDDDQDEQDQDQDDENN